MKTLPPMWNLWWTSGCVIVVCVMALAAQAHPAIDYGEAEWGLITLVTREILAIASKVADYYVGVKE